jgi:MFS family permease
MTVEAAAPVRYRDVLGHREFRGLVVAQVLSEVGDQIARVALALLVLDRTGSALGAAAAFALSFVPGFFGSAFLGPLADRLSRRSVMLVADAARFLVVGLIALVTLTPASFWWLFALMLIADLFTPAFDAARNATIPDVLVDPAEYAAGFGLSRSLTLVNQVVGLLVGGIVVQLVGATYAFLLNAASFAASFVVVIVTLAARPAMLEGGVGVLSVLRDARAGVGQLWRDPVRRMLLVLPFTTCVALVAPEALALAYSRDLEVSDSLGALLLTAVVAGGAVGSVVISRRRPQAQADLVLPMAVAASMLVLLVAFLPTIVPAVVLWTLIGFMQAYLVPCMAFTTMLTPPAERGRVVGLAAAGWALANVIAFLLAGWLADLTTPGFAIVVCGALGVVAVSIVLLTWPGAALRRRLRDLSSLDA